ncbi:hypothetical protein AC578_4023 [Pseudocercospora eumusae]|uniref:HNH nuclease domain-containing protein n=1 Tax=Pseudocercospora eumusae TaxID=321146 RepID=A0A139HDU0_9PEZI|nr:hypothetical protein AC578_4023 [Pseudocercospora eumusae]
MSLHSMMRFEPRPAVPDPVPAGSAQEVSHVVVLHPGYQLHNNVLLRLAATDANPLDARNTPGIAQHLVHAICAVITGNRFDCYLSDSPTPYPDPSSLPQPPDFLSAGEYYLHVPPPTNPSQLDPPWIYPIVPNFRQWLFPHDLLPDVWTMPPIAVTQKDQSAKERDASCRLTNHRETREMAHIIPRSEQAWLESNNMDRYGRGKTLSGGHIADAPENIVMLRHDVHYLWDKMDFSIVPKVHKSSQTWSWFAHVHSESTELQHLYHNLELLPLSYIRHELLFARLAWNIFPMLRNFLQRATRRHILCANKAEWRDVEECRSFCEGQGLNRSTSPRKSQKRKQSESAGQVDEGELEDDDASFDSGVSLLPRRSFSSDDSDTDEEEEEQRQMDHHSDDEEKALRQWRAAQAVSKSQHVDIDPFGLKRRREQEENCRGRKRVRDS